MAKAEPTKDYIALESRHDIVLIPFEHFGALKDIKFGRNIYRTGKYEFELIDAQPSFQIISAEKITVAEVTAKMTGE